MAATWWRVKTRDEVGREREVRVETPQWKAAAMHAVLEHRQWVAARDQLHGRVKVVEVEKVCVDLREHGPVRSGLEPLWSRPM